MVKINSVSSPALNLNHMTCNIVHTYNNFSLLVIAALFCTAMYIDLKLNACARKFASGSYENEKLDRNFQFILYIPTIVMKLTPHF